MGNKKFLNSKLGMDIMKINLKEIPRKFFVGLKHNIEIKDLGEVFLNDNEQVTFITEDNKRYDFVKKDWGYYGTPSINKRLKFEGFITALVKNKENAYYIMVVNKDKKSLFNKYCKDEDQEIIKWLSDFPLFNEKKGKAILKCSCNHDFREILFEYDKPPKGETDFNINQKEYKRRYEKCLTCGHCFSLHDIDLESLYKESYVNSTYKGSIHDKFKKIISLPPEKSDNQGRVKRIANFASFYKLDNLKINLLDIGSGLGVFPYMIKKLGWNCTAIDPDNRAIDHLEKELKINSIKGDLFDLSINENFEIITLNKVLEHVYDPVKMLIKASKMLRNHGFIYLELPDAEEASKEGKEREEFFIEHHHVFSMTSLNLMAKSAFLNPIKIERLKEPSGKYTLVAFLKKNN
tara:strand:- start:53 stop:1270 length:1218 start_codon:yes stop_codon:yes gene_type:complete